MWACVCGYAATTIKLSGVEAKNFVPKIWVPGAKVASGATGYRRVNGPKVDGFCLGMERGGE